VFQRIRATSPDRAEGQEAERHRLAALALARNCGMAVHPPGVRCGFNWDGAALNGATEAYVILHEIAHFMLAPPERRRLADFGLGPGPDTIDHDTAERAALLAPLARAEEEAEASLLGIVRCPFQPGCRGPLVPRIVRASWRRRPRYIGSLLSMGATPIKARYRLVAPPIEQGPVHHRSPPSFIGPRR
jgi:hypothetical protein